MKRMGTIIVASLCLLSTQIRAAEKSPSESLLGRWGITTKDLTHGSSAWLEITKAADNTYKVRFCGPTGGVGNLDQFKITDDKKIEFVTLDYQSENKNEKRKWHWTGQIEKGTLVGTRVNDDGSNKTEWNAVRFVPRDNFTGIWTIAENKAGLTGQLELLDKDKTIKGRLVGAETTALTHVKRQGNKLTFKIAQDGEGSAARTFNVTIKGDELDGAISVARKTTTAFKATRQRNWGKPIQLFNGKDLTGWKPVGKNKELYWKAEDGVLAQPQGGDNIQTEQKFQDFKLHIEFKVPEHGNSGVYLRGRYEIQVEDSFGAQPESHRCGGLYSRLTPPVNASKKAGEWQSYDVTLIGQYLTLKHNDQLLYDNAEIEGITGGALDSNEAAPGPLYLQGDHGAIWYRNITLTPAETPTAPTGLE